MYGCVTSTGEERAVDCMIRRDKTDDMNDRTMDNWFERDGRLDGDGVGLDRL